MPGKEMTMNAYIYLKLKPLESMQLQEEQKRDGKLGAILSRMLRRSVNYYRDEELQKMGSPLMWTE